MYEESGMIAALRKRPNLPGVIVSIIFLYLVVAWVTFYLVDANDFLGLRSLLVFTGALKPPVVWYHLFREGGLTEIMQWSLLAGTAYYARVMGKDFRASGNQVTASFWFLLSLAAFFMFLEDAVNVRHALSFLARLLFAGNNPQLVRTIAESLYFVVLGSIPLYALFRYGRPVWKDKGTRRFLLMGFAAYALAVGASGSRFIADWYNAAGHFIYNMIGRGSLIIPAGWQVADLEFFLMDWIVEESIELVGAAALFAAALTFFSKSGRVTGKVTGGRGTCHKGDKYPVPLSLLVLFLLLGGCASLNHAPDQGPQVDMVAEEEEHLDEIKEEDMEEIIVEEEPKLPPVVSMFPTAPVPGDHVHIEISNLDYLPEINLDSELSGELTRPYWDGDQVYLMWGISYHNEPGDYSLTLIISGEEDEPLEKAMDLTLLEGDFTYQQFSVVPSQTDDWTTERLQEDRQKVVQARENTALEPLWCGLFVWPVEGRISSDFGAVRVINQGEPRRHSGIDIAAPTGTPIVAPNCGEVRLAEHLLAHGKTIILDHGLGLTSAYLHMDDIQVEEGQAVEKGEIIGTVGATGFVTGAHLHWSIYIGHTPVSPYGFMVLD